MRIPLASILNLSLSLKSLLALYGDPMNIIKEKNSGLSLRSLYRPDKKFTGFFLAEISFFFKILFAICGALRNN